MKINLFKKEEKVINPNKDNLWLFLEENGFETNNAYNVKKWLKAFSYVSIGTVDLFKGKDEYGLYKTISEKYSLLEGKTVYAICIHSDNRRERDLLIPINSEEYRTFEENSLNSEIIEKVQFEAQTKFENDNERILNCLI